MMADHSQLREKIREVLEQEIPSDPEKIERAVNRILELVDPFERAVREELERFRSTFAELAK
jgi:hypothetical protein